MKQSKCVNFISLNTGSVQLFIFYNQQFQEVIHLLASRNPSILATNIQRLRLVSQKTGNPGKNMCVLRLRFSSFCACEKRNRRRH